MRKNIRHIGTTGNTLRQMLLLWGIPILFAIIALLHFRYTPDDSFIYFQYGRNLIEHGEFAFNVHEPSNGITGPAWMLVSALVYVLTNSIVVGTKIVDLLFAVSSIPLYYSVVRRAVNYRDQAILSMVFFAANSWFVRWAGSGMETSAAVFITLLLWNAMFRGRALHSSILLGILILVRPEAVIFLPLVYLYHVAEHEQPATAWLPLLRSFSITVLIVSAWSAFSFVVFGNVLSNTSNKVGWSLTIGKSMETLSDIVKTLGVTDSLFLLILIFMLPLVRKQLIAEMQNHSRWQLLIKYRKPLFLSAWFLELILFYTFSGTNVVSRYLLLITPALPLLCAMSYLLLQDRIPKYLKSLKYLSVVLTMLYIGQNQTFYWTTIEPRINEFQKSMESTMIPIALWLHNNTPEGSRVLAADIGAIGYFSQRAIDDAAGLISPEAISILRQGILPNEIIASRKYSGWSNPDYIIHRADVKNDLLPDDRLEAVYSAEFSGLKLDDTSSVYYTVYRCRKQESSE